MKSVSKLAVAGLIVSTISVISTPVLSAKDLTFTPRASVSLASYEFTQSARPNALAPTGINNNDFPEVKFDVTFKILGVGGTFIKDGMYLDIALQKSLDEEDSFSLSDANLDPNTPGVETFTETFEGDREDMSITLGKRFFENRAAFYVGYKTGKSEASGNQGQHLKFEEEGYFIGANYAWIFQGKGALSVNLAFADLDGDLVEDVTNPAFDSLTVPLDTNASSDAQGLSYGITWSARLSDDLSYSLGVDAKSYTFDDVTDNNPNAIPSDEFEETFVSITYSLFFLF